MIRSMFILGALRGIEAFSLADTRLRKLRTAIFKAVWSSRQPLANIGALLSLLDGPSCCDPVPYASLGFSGIPVSLGGNGLDCLCRAV